jgi:hypothetical protein
MQSSAIAPALLSIAVPDAILPPPSVGPYLRVLIPKNVIYFYHEGHEGLEDIFVFTSAVILKRIHKNHAFLTLL